MRSSVLTPAPRTVAVGSRNPVKIAAARAVLARVAPAATVAGYGVASGVPEQPWGDDETIRGARTRARAALAASGADLAVGFEGGVVLLPDGGVRSTAWAVVVGPDGREGVGGSLAVGLPPRVAARLKAGEALGPAMDAELGRAGIGQAEGMVGALTAGLMDRQAAYEVLVTYALAPWLAPQHWADGA